MKQKVVAQESDLKQHLGTSHRTAHGIEDGLKSSIWNYVELAAEQTLTVTMDGSWRTLDLSALVPATAVMVRLVFQAGGGTAGAYEYIYTRVPGHTTQFGDVARLYVKDSTSADGKIQQYACRLEQLLGPGKTIEYYIQKTNTAALYLVGYWVALA
jgi:hypothetical protein